MKIATPILAFLLAAVFPVLALADDTAVYGSGGAIQPMTEHPSIVMDEMAVHARVSPETTRVDCRFLFRNTGPETTVRMGFPESGNHNGGTDGFTSFDTWVDDEPAEVSIEGFAWGADRMIWRRWRVKTVRFAAGQTRHVRVRYTVRTAQDSVGGRRFEYAYGTGGSWKGPIGRASLAVVVVIPSGTLTARPFGGLEQAGRDRYSWRAQNLDPAPGDSAGVYLEPSRLTITVAGVERARLPMSDYVDRTGRSWASVRQLASWLGADSSQEGDQATITYGSRRLRFLAGRQWMDRDGERISLPAPPRVRSTELFVPIAAVSAALGVRVTYEPHRRTIFMSLPFTDVLAATVTIDGARQMFSWLSEQYAGWAPPLPAEYGEDVWPKAERDTFRPPWIASGDFDGDGNRDVALLLLNGDEMGLGVVRCTGGGGDRCESIDFQWLPGSPHERLTLLDGTLFTVLRTHPPGEVAYYAEGETSPKSGRLILQHDGIEAIFWGKAASLWYWDERSRAFKRVTIAD